MAYGMTPDELARVGQNVNKQGGGVDEQAIASAMNKELDTERKDQVRRFNERKQSARSDDAKKKAALKKGLVSAVVESGITLAKSGAFDKKPGVATDAAKPTEIAPLQQSVGAKDNLIAGKPQPRLKMSGSARQGPDMNSKDYLRAKRAEAKDMRKMYRQSKRSGTGPETDSELLSILGG